MCGVGLLGWGIMQCDNASSTNPEVEEEVEVEEMRLFMSEACQPTSLSSYPDLISLLSSCIFVKTICIDSAESVRHTSF